MTAPESKRQHFVPQFYLRRFAQDDKHLFVFDKFKTRTFRSTITKAATERFFYDIAGHRVDSDDNAQLVETALSSLEAQFADKLDSLLASVDEDGSFPHELKPPVAFFLKVQYFRTPESRRVLIETAEKSAQRILDDMIPGDGAEGDASAQYRVRFNASMAPLEHAKLLFDPRLHAAFVATLLEHIWFVGLNGTPQSLYTSDHPVVRIPHKDDPLISYAGFGSEGIEIAFPLTPKHVLVLCERAFFREFAHLDCGSLALNTENVTYYNSRQVIESYRHVYSKDDDFDLAERICRDHPAVSRPDRTRVEVR